MRQLLNLLYTLCSYLTNIFKKKKQNDDDNTKDVGPKIGPNKIEPVKIEPNRIEPEKNDAMNLTIDERRKIAEIRIKKLESSQKPIRKTSVIKIMKTNDEKRHESIIRDWQT